MAAPWRSPLLHGVWRRERHAGLKLLAAVTLSATQLAMAPASPLGATTVYRCGPAGHDYSQWPCPEGQAVDVRQDQRTAEQTSSAMRVAHGEQELAQGLEQARLRQEIEAAGTTAMTSPRPHAPAAETVRPPAPSHPRRHGKRLAASPSEVSDETAPVPFTAVAPRNVRRKKTKKNVFGAPQTERAVSPRAAAAAHPADTRP